MAAIDVLGNVDANGGGSIGGGGGLPSVFANKISVIVMLLLLSVLSLLLLLSIVSGLTKIDKMLKAYYKKFFNNFY